MDDCDEIFDGEESTPFTDGPMKGKYIKVTRGGVKGIAYYVVADDDDGMLTAVMVGDDHRYTFADMDVEEIPEGDFCDGCGQIGCNCG